MMSGPTCLLVLILIAGCAMRRAAPADSQLPKPDARVSAPRQTAQVAGNLKYLLYLPADYEHQKRWPLILYLHGRSLRGDDLAMLKRYGLAALLEKELDIPFVVISPQCPRDKLWTDEEEALLDLIAKVARDLRLVTAPPAKLNRKKAQKGHAKEMNRREFASALGISTIALGVRRAKLASAKPPWPQIALTMDDFSWANAVKLTAEQRNQAILRTLEAYSVKAGLFVVGRNIEEEQGKQLLWSWNDAGHLIGNHTYSHRNYNDPEMSTAIYGKDILRAESMLKAWPRFRKFFRFPMLKEGDTAAKRDQLRAFLSRHGYRNGHVTIDNSDWFIDQRLRARLQKRPAADLTPYRDFYLEHMWDRAQYYDGLARQVLSRPVKHTILTHFNLLNGLFLGDLMEMFQRHGWHWISAEEAFADPVFAWQPKVLPAGESIIWALAKETGKIRSGFRYPAEDGEYELVKMDKLGL